MIRVLRASGLLPPMDEPTEPEDLKSQLESILDAVWKAEANWTLDDRIDLATGHRRRRKDLEPVLPAAAHKCTLARMPSGTWTHLVCKECGQRWDHRGNGWYPACQ